MRIPWVFAGATAFFGQMLENFLGVCILFREAIIKTNNACNQKPSADQSHNYSEDVDISKVCPKNKVSESKKLGQLFGSVYII